MPDFTTFPGPHVRGDGGSRRLKELQNPRKTAFFSNDFYVGTHVGTLLRLLNILGKEESSCSLSQLKSSI